jgi:putative glutamine amidotransferase
MSPVKHRPRIALTLSRPQSPTADGNNDYREALERAGAEVVALYPGDEVPQDVDGLLLDGGGDIDPGRYRDDEVGSADIDPERDELEFAIARQAIERDLPVLGICRGFQVLNVVRGGKLVQDVSGHAEPGYPLIQHYDVRPLVGSRLDRVTGGRAITVNSRHHQAVTTGILGTDLVATAEVDGLVEAFEATDRRWVVGVQWHPERKHEVSVEAADLIDAFVAEAATARVATPER